MHGYGLTMLLLALFSSALSDAQEINRTARSLEEQQAISHISQAEYYARMALRSLEASEKIGKALAILAADLPNPFDESTDYFRAFSAPFAVDDQINEASLREALKIGARYELDISDLTNLGEGCGEPEESGFRVLQSALGATLRETN